MLRVTNCFFCNFTSHQITKFLRRISSPSSPKDLLNFCYVTTQVPVADVSTSSVPPDDLCCFVLSFCLEQDKREIVFLSSVCSVSLFSSFFFLFCSILFFCPVLFHLSVRSHHSLFSCVLLYSVVFLSLFYSFVLFTVLFHFSLPFFYHVLFLSSVPFCFSSLFSSITLFSLVFCYILFCFSSSVLFDSSYLCSKYHDLHGHQSVLPVRVFGNEAFHRVGSLGKPHRYAARKIIAIQ